jgi:hypothetical protein
MFTYVKCLLMYSGHTLQTFVVVSLQFWPNQRNVNVFQKELSY